MFHVFLRIPSQNSWHWAIAQVNSLSALLVPGYGRGESPLSFLGTGLQQKRIPSPLFWLWAAAQANPLSAFRALGYGRSESPFSSLGTGLKQMRIPFQLSSHWATAEANPLSAFLALGYSRGESPFSSLGIGLQQRRIPSQFSWHWATAEANILLAFLALSYSKGESSLSFPSTGLQQRRIPSKISSHWVTADGSPLSAFLSFWLLLGRIPSHLALHWATAEANPLSAFLTHGYSRGESPLSFPGTGLQHRHKLRFPHLKNPALSKILSFNSGVGQNQALRVSHAARNSTILISLSGRIRLFPNPPSIFLFFALLGTADRDIEVPFAVNSGLSEIPSCIEHDRLSLECFACCKVFYRRNFFFPVHLKGRLYYK